MPPIFTPCFPADQLEPTGCLPPFEMISALGKASLKGTNYSENRWLFPFKFPWLSQVSSPFSGLAEVLPRL